jgi:large subunit ribosomal protein L13Ae
LASNIAKAALQGQKIVVVRAEEMFISGPIKRNEGIFQKFLNKTHITNPRRGPFHHRTPSAIFLRKVRGMIPYKTTRGLEALERIQAFEGIPKRYAKKKRVVVPSALKVTNLKTDSPVTRLGDLAQKVGWKYGPVVAELEVKRKAAGKQFHQKKVTQQLLWAKAEKQAGSNADYKNVVDQLAAFGY